MIIQNSQQLLQHIDSGGSLSFNRQGQIQEQSGAAKFFQSIGDAFRSLSESGRAKIEARTIELGNAMGDMVARDKLPNLAQGVLPSAGALKSEGAKMLARMEVVKQVANFPSGARQLAKKMLLNSLTQHTEKNSQASLPDMLQVIKKESERLHSPMVSSILKNKSDILNTLRTDNSPAKQVIDQAKDKAMDIMGEVGGVMDNDAFTRQIENKIESFYANMSLMALKDMAETTAREMLGQSVIHGLMTGNTELLQAVDQGKAKVLGALEGQNSVMDDTIFFQKLESKISNSSEKVTPQKLEELAEMTARASLAHMEVTKQLADFPSETRQLATIKLLNLLAEHIEENPHASLPDMLQFIAEKNENLRSPGGMKTLESKKDLLNMMKTGDAAVMQIIDNAKGKAMDSMEDLGGVIDNDLFTRQLESKLELHPYKVSLGTLKDMAERTAQEVLGQSVVHNLMAGNNELSKAVNQTKAHVSALLGGLGGVMDDIDFFQTLKSKISNSSEPVTSQKLQEMADITARGTLGRSIIDSMLKAFPGSAELTPLEVTMALDQLPQCPQGVALLKASSASSAKSLAVVMQNRVNVDLQSTVDSRKLQHELSSAGLKEFCVKTGMSEEEGKKLNLTNLRAKLNITRSELDASLKEKNPGTYIRADRNALMAAWKGMAQRFFDDRATAYNSIAGLSVPQPTKELWLNSCLSAQLKIQGDTFTKSAELAHYILAKEPMRFLSDSKLTAEEKLDALADIAVDVEGQRRVVFGEERVENMGLDERFLILGFVFGVVRQSALDAGQSFPSQNTIDELLTLAGQRMNAVMDEVNDPDDPEDQAKLRGPTLTREMAQLLLEQQ